MTEDCSWQMLSLSALSLSVNFDNGCKGAMSLFLRVVVSVLFVYLFVFLASYGDTRGSRRRAVGG